MKAVFITHSGPVIGGGHLSRCFALSEALERVGCPSSWILNNESKSHVKSLGLKNVSFFADPFTDQKLLSLPDASFAVIDSYAPDAGFYRAISRYMPVVAVDDLADRGVEEFSSVVLNYGISARRSMYGNDSAFYMIGPEYVLLRPEYWDLEPGEGGYVLFVPGAADVAGASLRIVDMWGADMPRLEIVLGPLVGEGMAGSVVRAANRSGRDINVKVAPQNFPILVAEAGMVICTASVTAYEALALEKRLAVFSVAENQKGFGKVLNSMNVACDLGEWGSVTAEKLAEAVLYCPAIGAMKGLVNKRGALKCASELLSGRVFRMRSLRYNVI